MLYLFLHFLTFYSKKYCFLTAKVVKTAKNMVFGKRMAFIFNQSPPSAKLTPPLASRGGYKVIHICRGRCPHRPEEHRRIFLRKNTADFKSAVFIFLTMYPFNYVTVPAYLAFAALFLSHFDTHSEQAMSPVMLSVVRPMSKRRSIP